MDIRKLQRVIVDALEDVKAQHIVVFNTEEQSPLFERVIVASGTSNRQTKALASSVRDAVKTAGYDQPRVEGEDNGEWIIVDCGAAVVHVMQPDIRTYYHLEEIWGAKPVRLKLGAAPAGLVKASVQKRPDEDALAARKVPAKKAAAKKAPASKSKPSNGAARSPVAPGRAASAAAPARKAPAKRPAAKKSATSAPIKKIVVGKPAPRAPAKKSAAGAPARPVARKTRSSGA
ncbi:MAG: ribosome silencing factor [Pseudomonadota bacterium]